MSTMMRLTAGDAGKIKTYKFEMIIQNYCSAIKLLFK